MLKHLIIHLLCAGLLLGCSPRKDSGEPNLAVTKMTELKNALCACEDVACGDLLAASLLAPDMLEAVAGVSERTKESFLKEGSEAHACLARLKQRSDTTTNPAGNQEQAASNPAEADKKAPVKAEKTVAEAEPPKPKIEIPALQFHVERHRQLCACKKVTGPGKSACLKKTKEWESRHTIKKATKKATKQELAARGKQIAQALSQIPCDGPTGSPKKPQFKIAPGAKLSPAR